MSRYRNLVKSFPSMAKLRFAKKDKELEQAVFDLFQSMGGVYIKFLQILISNTTTMQHIDPVQKMSVFTKSTPSVIDHEHIITTQLKPHQFNQLEWISSKPFATGSFANVYRATLNGGRNVIIKVKRPGLADQLKTDFRILSIIVNVLAATQKNAKLNIKTVAHEYAEGIKREVDYQQEVRNADTFYRAYSSHKDIFIPETHTELCTEDIIVQDYVDGAPLSDFLESSDPVAEVERRTGSDLKQQLSVIGIDILERTFAGKLVHGDPHPGNIILLADNKIAFIDFGLIAEPANDSLGYLEYMKEQTFINRGQLRPGKFAIMLMRSYSQKLYHSLYFVDSRFDHLKIFKNIEQRMDRRFYSKAGDPNLVCARMQHGHTTEIFDQIINPDNQLGLSGNVDGLVMRRACHTVWSTIIGLGLYKEIIPAIYEEAVRRGQNSASRKPFTGVPSDMEEAFEVIAEWLMTIRETDPIFFATVRDIFPKSMIRS